MGNPEVSLKTQNLIPIPDMDGYFTDTLGEIISNKGRGPRKLSKRLHFGRSKNPYYRTKVDGTNALAHRIIASVHIGRPLIKGEQVNHIDGDTLNNSLNNLEVVSHASNVLHAVENNLYCSGEAWHKARGRV